ncbi:MAG TPA: hypothetical protein ENI57_02935 [Ignavibacteria bacterium]|nr:hypothetical protein [Ignavibacteria bacterium]
MSASTKLSNSVKALCYLADSKKPCNSIEISEKTGINASKLRKLLSLLCKNQIVQSNKGAFGGFSLNKNTDEILLQEIYCAIEDRKAFDLHSSLENKNNSFYNSEINKYFLDLFENIQVDIEKKMRKITLKEILKKTRTYKR